jgi:hypothetical protein
MGLLFGRFYTAKTVHRKGNKKPQSLNAEAQRRRGAEDTEVRNIS